jgi:alpha-glucosidase
MKGNIYFKCAMYCCIQFFVYQNSLAQSSKSKLTNSPNFDIKNEINGVKIRSPDQHILFSLDKLNGKYCYAISYGTNQVIKESNLGLVLTGEQIEFDVPISALNKYEKNEIYPTRGVHNLAKNKYKGAKIQFLVNEKTVTLDVRVFNDGVAFRYLVNTNGQSIIEKDLTTFQLPEEAMIWSQPNNKHYEGKYTDKRASEFEKGEILGPPITIQFVKPKLYAAITEAGLTDFAGMSLVADEKAVFHAYLSGNTKKNNGFETSWRVILMGSDLNTLVNSDIISNVSPKYDEQLFPKGYDTDWVKPGRSVWSWLSGDQRVITFENMKKFSDQAAELGFEYNLVDEGWGNWKDGDKDHWDLMKNLVDYSAKKGVKIWVWKAYPDRRGIEGLKDEAKRTAFFKRCSEIGVAGVKIDFFDSESQEIIEFYQAALKEAAGYHLMLNFHGANKPTGETRTWPNEMSREAIKGMEGRPPWAKHNAILPFTRYLAGHADYTPIHFGDRVGEVTWAHHIATLAIFNSPFLCLGASPQSIIDHPFKDMIISIPSVWDETIVLPQSEIGELVLLARRKGSQWFIAGLNGVHEAKSMTLDLSFLGKGKYQMTAIKDNLLKQAWGGKISTAVNAKSILHISLNPEGGFIAKLDKLNK